MHVLVSDKNKSKQQHQKDKQKRNPKIHLQ